MPSENSIDTHATSALAGLMVLEFNFSRGGFGFVLTGRNSLYSVATNYEMSVSQAREPLSKADFSARTWPLLEQSVVDVSLGENDSAFWATFTMDGGGELVGWQLRSDAKDNIFIVRSLKDEAWFTIG